MAIPVNKQKYTYKDYLTWTEGDKWELINGDPFLMSPAPSRIHQEISMKLVNEIYNYLKGKPCKVYAAPFDVRLSYNEENEDNITNVVQPDIAVICDENKLDERGAKGAPDLIIEIVSPSSTFLDYVKKLNLYGDYGVKEYWIVNPKNQNLFVYKIDETGKYDAPSIYSGNDKVKVGIFQDLIISLGYLWEE